MEKFLSSPTSVLNKAELVLHLLPGTGKRASKVYALTGTKKGRLRDAQRSLSQHGLT